MIIDILDTTAELARKAAHVGGAQIRAAIDARGTANIILATGASQIAVLECLVREPDIPWSKVTAFHLDEYLDLPVTHKASFRRYMKMRFVEQVKNLREFVYVEGDVEDTVGEIKRISQKIAAVEIDVAFVGIGENGHLAFNDPPADFETVDPFIVVDLDEKCRTQQVNEGWFESFADVPSRAISMSIAEIMRSKSIICSAPDERKAAIVKETLEGPITNMCPASILRTHPATRLLLDADSAALINHDQSMEIR